MVVSEKNATLTDSKKYLVLPSGVVLETMEAPSGERSISHGSVNLWRSSS